MTAFETDGSAGIPFRKELMRQDDFDSVMAPLGRMISLSSFLEQFYRISIARLLRCHDRESAFIASRAIRGLDNIVDLTEKLFAVNFPDQNTKRMQKRSAWMLPT
jgi:hypothetical protein